MRLTINGIELTEGQIMALRVALGNFQSYLLEEGLGQDLHGRMMTEAYLARLRELVDLVH